MKYTRNGFQHLQTLSCACADTMHPHGRFSEYVLLMFEGMFSHTGPVCGRVKRGPGAPGYRLRIKFVFVAIFKRNSPKFWGCLWSGTSLWRIFLLWIWDIFSKRYWRGHNSGVRLFRLINFISFFKWSLASPISGNAKIYVEKGMNIMIQNICVSILIWIKFPWGGFDFHKFFSLSMDLQLILEGSAVVVYLDRNFGHNVI